MKKKVVAILIAAGTVIGMTGCESEASKVEYNLNKYTLNFNPNMWLPYEVETID